MRNRDKLGGHVPMGELRKVNNRVGRHVRGRTTDRGDEYKDLGDVARDALHTDDITVLKLSLKRRWPRRKQTKQ
jgi:hypothetical protein